MQRNLKHLSKDEVQNYLMLKISQRLYINETYYFLISQAKLNPITHRVMHDVMVQL
jgi:hypothetical protein